MPLFIRQWTTEWDLWRLDPGYSPRVTATAVDLGALVEDRDLEIGGPELDGAQE